ncbi:RNA metabolism protein [Lithospermum erythrorhizon]|uniref:RNA metabolism protein n=1 Tax=Lithospermum erythrorhizon TaxID=34254 RepID=A0AAV3PA54_LITER
MVSSPSTTTTTTTTTAAAVDVEAEQQQKEEEDDEERLEPSKNDDGAIPKWPGWPGCNVYRLIVPVLKVGSIIGRKGEFVKKLCEDTRARVRVLDGPVGSSDRIVLISGKEDPEAELPPAMDAALKVFKRVSGLTSSDGSNLDVAIAGAAFCSIRLLVASVQATHLIGKQGCTVKFIQESSGAAMRILSEDELPSYGTSEERVVDIHGEAMKVLQALTAVLVQLRKFLVDQTVLPIFEKNHNATIQPERGADSWADKTYSSSVQPTTSVPYVPHSVKRDPYLRDLESQIDSKLSYLQSCGADSALASLRSSVSRRTVTPVVTQMAKIMQIPLIYAEDIIGIGGANIAYIRRNSGAVLTVQESGGLPDEITIEIKGTSSQVEAAEQLIQDFINNHKDPVPSIYGRSDLVLQHMFILWNYFSMFVILNIASAVSLKGGFSGFS